MKRKIGLVTTILLLAFLGWYLFIKPYDYLVRFEVKALPGTINQTVKLSNNSIKGSRFVSQENIAHFTYEMNHNDSIFTYEWDIQKINDSLSKVRVYVSNPDNRLQNRLKIPFADTPFKLRADQTLKTTLKTLHEHLKRIKVSIVGESEIPDTYCLCVPLKDTQRNKANGMMKNYSFLSSMVLKNNLQLNGSPLVEVTDWQVAKDSLHFNFCNPIIKPDSLPEIAGVFYKQVKGRKALKAIYNGNYITSDRAWYALLNHADNNQIEVEKKPLEIFYNNPSTGSDELNWKAEIYMPIK